MSDETINKGLSAIVAAMLRNPLSAVNFVTLVIGATILILKLQFAVDEMKADTGNKKALRDMQITEINSEIEHLKVDVSTTRSEFTNVTKELIELRVQLGAIEADVRWLRRAGDDSPPRK